MTVDDPNDLGRVDREIHINELRHQAEDLTDGDIVSYEDPDAPSEVIEQYWENVIAYETAPHTTHFDQLTRAGIDLPPPETLDDAALADKLWEIIRGLADIGTFLSSTDHLSDRELYDLLWNDLLREAGPELPLESGWITHLDILGSGSEDDLYLRMKYYADQEERRMWHEEWPDDEMPDHVDPPYDRDRHLPADPLEAEMRRRAEEHRTGEDRADDA
jgi:hypothetical protein